MQTLIGAAGGATGLQARPAVHHELRFEHLDRAGRAVVFPCDPRGVVNLDALSPSMRESYARARARVGMDLAYPAVVRMGA